MTQPCESRDAESQRPGARGSALSSGPYVQARPLAVIPGGPDVAALPILAWWTV